MRKPAFVAIVRSGISGKETGKRLLSGLAGCVALSIVPSLLGNKAPLSERILPDDDVAFVELARYGKLRSQKSLPRSLLAVLDERSFEEFECTCNGMGDHRRSAGLRRLAGLHRVGRLIV